MSSTASAARRRNMVFPPATIGRSSFVLVLFYIKARRASWDARRSAWLTDRGSAADAMRQRQQHGAAERTAQERADEGTAEAVRATAEHRAAVEAGAAAAGHQGHAGVVGRRARWRPGRPRPTSAWRRGRGRPRAASLIGLVHGVTFSNRVSAAAAGRPDRSSVAERSCIVHERRAPRRGPYSATPPWASWRVFVIPRATPGRRRARNLPESWTRRLDSGRQP